MTFVPPATSVDPELYLESDEDVRLYEDVSGSFRGFWRYYGSEKIFALVDLDDGRKVHVWTYYFRRFGREIFKIKEGERISLHKTSYDPRGAYTSWKVKSVPLRYFLNPAGPNAGQVFISDYMEFPSDYERGDIVNGRVVAIGHKNIARVCLIVKPDKGHVIRVNSDMFAYSYYDIRNYEVGDPIRLMKMGFMRKESRTKWLILDPNDIV